MYAVSFFENKNLLLSQLAKRVPVVGEELRIKGRKATVSSVNNLDERRVHVQVALEVINKNTKLVVDQSKKKKR
ncbi:hypothetical protein HPT25_10665 [Bacillus sp. BRMEA1]|nr:hypothetical protein [Neobacillus endophyticus]